MKSCRALQVDQLLFQNLSQNVYTQRYEFLKFTALKALCNNWLLNFKKFWSSYQCESEFCPETKLFTMFIYTTYWKDRFFQRHLRVNPGHDEKYAIKTRKTRISAEIDIQKNSLFISDKLDIYSNQIKK